MDLEKSSENFANSTTSTLVWILVWCFKNDIIEFLASKSTIPKEKFFEQHTLLQTIHEMNSFFVWLGSWFLAFLIFKYGMNWNFWDIADAVSDDDWNSSD